MEKKLSLKNTPLKAIVDEHVYEHLTTDPYLVKIGFLENIRLHSAGYAVFQKSFRRDDGYYKVETIYLHKYILGKFSPRDSNENKSNSVRVLSENKLDCRLANMEWASEAHVARRSKSYGKTGYRGVYKYLKSYKALIYAEKRAETIGVYDTAEEAAEAYNKRAVEVYGKYAVLNEIGSPRIAEPKKKNTSPPLVKNGVVKKNASKKKVWYVEVKD